MPKAYNEEINFERGQDHDSNNDLENIFENVEYEVKDDEKK